MIIFIPYIYLLIGFYSIINNLQLYNNYIILLIFFTFKILSNYRKCTFSYLECKIRGVKKNEGYLNNFLDLIIDLRYTEHLKVLFILTMIIFYYHFIIKQNSLKILFLSCFEKK